MHRFCKRARSKHKVIIEFFPFALTAGSCEIYISSLFVYSPLIRSIILEIHVDILRFEFGESEIDRERYEIY